MKIFHCGNVVLQLFPLNHPPESYQRLSPLSGRLGKSFLEKYFKTKKED
jgi:hypothetical protein